LISNVQAIDSPNVPLLPALNLTLLRFDHICVVVGALGVYCTGLRALKVVARAQLPEVG
jgi:hypothetical protein